MKKGWIVLIGVILLMGAASYAATRLIRQTPASQPAPCPGFALLQDYLQLTADQRRALAQVDAIYAKTRPALRERVWQARDELLTALHDPNSTLHQATAAARRLGSAQQALQTNTIEYTFELRKHLTPAQREKMMGVMGRGMCALTCGPGLGRAWGGCGGGPGRTGGCGPMGPRRACPGRGSW